MRWIVGLVTSLCLLAATGVRPDPGVRERERSQLVDATHALAGTFAARRGGVAPDLRLDAFALPSERSFAAPRVTVRALAHVVAPRLVDRDAPVPSARGPPTRS